MSSLKVEVVQVDNILPHPNADRLELAAVRGWICVVPKGQFELGTTAVYFPIDSILPAQLELALFPDGSKVKLHNHRIKTIRLRGAVSQGLLVSLSELGQTGLLRNRLYDLGEDLTPVLGVTKYEPPELKSSQPGCQQVNKKQINPNFHKYTDIENWKNYPELFAPNESIWVLEKIHGSNFRAGYVKTNINTLWKRLKNWLGLLPSYEFVYGSHNIQLQNKRSQLATNFYTRSIGKNIYWEMVEKYHLQTKLLPDRVVYGEVYGDKIQKGYLYDCQPGERKLAIFDVQLFGEYICHEDVIDFCYKLNLPFVPVDCFGVFKPQDYVSAPSHLGAQVREGVVVKPEFEGICLIGRKILKLKSAEFLLTQEDDTH